MGSTIRARLSFVALALVVGSLTGCGDDGAPDGADGRGSTLETAEDGRLVVCTEAPRFPFAYEKEGELVGFEVELARAVGANLNLDVEIRPLMGDRILASVSRRVCDLAASAIPVTTSEDGVQLSSGYLEIQHSLLVRKADAARLTHVAALRDQTVGVLSKTEGAEQARDEAAKHGMTVQEFEWPNELVGALVQGRIQGVIQHHLANAYQAKERPETAVTEVLPPSDTAYGFAVSKRNAALLDAVNFAIASLRTDGTLDRLLLPYR